MDNQVQKTFDRIDRTASVRQMRLQLEALSPALQVRVVKLAMATSRFKWTWGTLALMVGVPIS